MRKITVGRVRRKRDVFAMQSYSRTDKERDKRFICKKVRVQKVDIKRTELEF